MNTFLVVIAGILPAAVLVFYIYMRDKHQREPLTWILRAVGYGAACTLPAIVIELLLATLYPGLKTPTLGGALYEGFVVAALTEESMKLLFLWLFLRKNPYFDERMDCIVYACCVSMGFAGLENVGYLFDSLDELAEVAVSRAILAVPGHFFDAVFMGYFMSMAIWGRPERKKLNWVLTLLVPVLLHGIYDACLMSFAVSDEVMVTSFFIFIVLGLYVWIVGHQHIARLLLRDARKPVRPMPQQAPEASSLVPSEATGGYVKDEKGTFLVQPAPPAETVTSDSQMAEPLDEPYADYGDEDYETRGFSNKGIFRRPLSFNGRIRRREYAASFLIYFFWYMLLLPSDDAASSEYSLSDTLFLITFVPVIWFFIAQSCKRCHDLVPTLHPSGLLYNSFLHFLDIHKPHPLA